MGQTYQKIKRICYIVILFGLSEFVCTIPYEIHIKYIMHIKHLVRGSIV